MVSCFYTWQKITLNLYTHSCFCIDHAMLAILFIKLNILARWFNSSTVEAALWSSRTAKGTQRNPVWSRVGGQHPESESHSCKLPVGKTGVLELC